MTEPTRTPAEAPAARTVKLPELIRTADAAGKPAFAGNFDLIQNVKVQIGVSLGTAEMTVAELFALKDGSVVALQQPSDAPIDILLDGRLIGRGELVVVGDTFGVRITEIGAAP